MNTISGVHAVREALRAGPQSIRKIVVAEGSLDARKREILSLARASGIPVYREPRDRVGTQGVTAELVAFEWSDFHELLQGAKTPAFFLALDHIEDPRNFGAVIRAAEGAGVDGVVVPERKTAPPSEVAISASAGALHHAKVARVRNLSDALTEMKERGIWSVGLTPSAKAPWHSFDYTEPVILVLGGEGRGLRRRVAKTCDTLVSLPQRGCIESLNVSVAAGITLYEVLRQRTRRNSTSWESQSPKNGPNPER